MKKKKLIIVLVSLTTFVVSWGIFFSNKNSSKIDEKVTSDTTAVEVYKVSNSNIEKYKKFSGITSAGEKEVVTPKALSKIVDIKVKEGAYVKKGQVLMTLDSSKLDEQIAQLDETNKKMQETINGTKGKVEELKNKRDDILVKKTNLEKENIDLEALNLVKDEELTALKVKLEKEEITQEEYDKNKKEIDDLKSVNTTKVAKNKVEIKTLEITKATLDKSIEEFSGMLDGSLGKSEMSDMLDGLKDKKGNYTVVAGISGVVKELNLKVGQMPMSFTKPGILIENTDSIDFDFSVEKENLDKFKVGMDVKVYVDVEGKEVEKVAKIESITDQADERTKQYKIVATISNLENEVKTGSFAKIMLETDIKNDVIVVPKDAILREENKNYVYLEIEGTAKKIEVITGIENHNKVEVISGVDVGDKVIVKGKEFIVLDEKINVVKEVKLSEDN
ncbi:MAG: efflux RND transporter periplasmic adaptor subunit [Sarcina sp.]